MQRYILEDKTKKFSENDYHHIKNVMRMNDGDLVVVCFENKCYKASLKFLNNDINYKILEEISSDDFLDVTLIQGYLKGSKIETTVKYATIFGASQIILTEFERNVAKLKNSEHKLKRYNQISKEAAELARRNNVPEIKAITKLKDINYNEFDLIILADEEEETLTINKLDLEKYKNKKIAIIIGPEGGISNTERLFFKEINAKSVTLGKYIYPAEIASIKLLAVMTNITFDN